MTFYNCQTAVISAFLIVSGPVEKQWEGRLSVADTLRCITDMLEPARLPDEPQWKEKDILQ